METISQAFLPTISGRGLRAVRNGVMGLALTVGVGHSSAATSTASDIKEQIIRLATENMTNIDSRPQVRAQLEQLVAQLQAESGPVSEEAIGRYSAGSWQQLWADERDNSPPGSPKQDLAKIYQVVSPQGWGFNFGVRNVNPQVAVTFALQVSASVTGNVQTTTITKAFSRASALEPGESVGDMALQIFEGKSQDFIERNAGQFPEGPIGAKGTLTIQYIDENLKIGTGPNVYTGESEMYVMLRRDLVGFGNP
jgi:hypothetical protein